MEVLKIKLKNYLRMKVLKIKFENWNFGKLLENEIFKIKFANQNFGKLFENGSFENWNFENLFENEIFIKIKILTSKDEELREPNTQPFLVVQWGWPCMAMQKRGLGVPHQ